ncbi:MAG: 3'-5' exoribonuclease [Clostridia bacterium]|nr:3'-5' exoribonuclease [Clostridia bacterium]
MAVFALDVETASGEKGSICALGLCRITEHGIETVMNTLCDPQTLFDARCIAVHGILPRDVIGAPTLDTVLTQLFGYIENATVAAHNAPFDFSHIRAAAAQRGIPVPSFTQVCTVRLARKTFPGRKSYALAALADLVPFPFVHHDACEDARACAAIYRACEREARISAMAAQIAAQIAKKR